jgi:P-type Ca2+ transporter type 2C
MKNKSIKGTISQPWMSTRDDIITRLDVKPEEGLSKNVVKQRQKEFGKNQLQTKKEKSVLSIAADQFKSLIIVLLAVSAVLSFVFGELIEGLAILGVILINALIGFFTELRAVRSMEALRKMSLVKAKVRREGYVNEIDARELTKGDILVFNGGDIVTADARLLEASKLRINEAALTGESLPVDKQVKPLPEDTVLADRNNMVYKGTAVARGSGEAVVVATGMSTELGNISSLVLEAEEEVTPLEKRLEVLGRKLIYATLGLAAFVTISGWVFGRDLRLMIETSIALAVAAIPEGLPIVATIALARGMRRMANQNALINKLSSVETLGATSVIISDKTGTLTENQMTVTHIALSEGDIKVSGEAMDLNGQLEWKETTEKIKNNEILIDLLTIADLCNEATLKIQDGQIIDAIGEPLEIALKIVVNKGKNLNMELKDDMPEVRLIAFEESTKLMATVHQLDEDQYFYAVKGSPEAILEASVEVATPEGNQALDDECKNKWLKKIEFIAGRGLRIIAFAKKILKNEAQDPYSDLTLLGLVGMMDPAREEVRSAIQQCHSAGIRVIMATGDLGKTALEIAKATNLVESDAEHFLLGSDLKDINDLSTEKRKEYLKTKIFARVNPEQKLNLIEMHQWENDIVAMTGDGINDAPALKKADIGIAMGSRGTQVAKEAADMVLKDDYFGTIVSAVEQGRVIFSNIQKFVHYLLSCNISEIMVVTVATMVDMPMPLLPLQILFLNLITDVFPALALGVGEGGQNIMSDAPRDSDEPIITNRHWSSMGIYGFLITGTVIIGMFIALNNLSFEAIRATTIAFLILAFSQLWHVFNMRKNSTNIFRNEITENPFIWIALSISICLVLLALYIPFLADLMSLVNPGLNGWLLVIGASLIPLVIGQLLKTMKVII